MSPPNILLIEDDCEMRRWLRVILEAEGYRLLFAETGEQGVIEAAARRPELILLDLGLPDLDGVDVIHRVRGWSATPIVVISARGQEKYKVEALDAGADDYVSKPFGVGELLARLRVALRHAATVRTGTEATRFKAGGLEVDLAARWVRVDGQDVHLTPIEYKLLTTLARHPGRMLTHRQLLKEVWGPNFVEHNNYLRVHMSQLRRKIEEQPARPRYILTEPGVGYRLAEDP
ncbi:MAG: response regulator [Acidobacteria bacterium]|nr:response regulator [Acidobacteriota bacterium]